MIGSSPGTYMAVFLVPVIFLATVYVLRIQRQQAEAERSALPFEPQPEPMPGIFPRRFSPPECAYLRLQMKSLPYVFAYTTWIFAFLLLVPVFIPWGHAHLWTDRPAMYWFAFMDSVAQGPQSVGMMILLVAMGAVMPMRSAGSAPFYRTRPVSIGMLFWGRVLPWLAVIEISIVTAMALAFAAFYALHGAAWQHLPAVIPRKLGPDDADVAAKYAGLLVTSVPRVFLSFFTASCLYAGIAVLAASVPVGGARGRAGPRGLVLVIASVAIMPSLLNLVAAFNDLHALRWLFFYTEFGPPPPYVDALAPLSIAVVCVLLARRLMARVEL